MKLVGRRVAQAVLLIFLLVCIFISVWRCAENLRAKEQANVLENLQARTELSAATFSENILGIEHLLQALSQEYIQLTDNGATVQQCISIMASIEGSDSFTRFGISLPDGTSYTTDGLVADLSGEEGFDETLAGHFTISDTIYDTYDASAPPIHVFRYPVVRDGTVVAEVFATYTTDEFKSLLGLGATDDTELVSAIVTSDGSLICATEGSLFDLEGVSMLERLQQFDNGEEAVSQLRANFAKAETGTAEFLADSHEGEKKHLMSFAPLTMENASDTWFLACSVPATIVDSQIDDVMYDVYRMMVLVIVLVLAIVVVSLFNVVFEARKHRKELERMVYVDPLTGGETAERFRERVKELGRSCVIVAADIRSFKTIESICGKKKSDEIIRSLWESIVRNLREGELVGREASDRFFICLNDCDARGVLARLQPIFDEVSEFSTRLDVPHMRLVAGSCVWGGLDDLEAACNNAAAAKRELSMRNDLSVSVLDYSQLDLEAFERDRTMVASFASAIDAREFEAWYQPKYDPRSGDVIGAEALVRWRKPDGSLVPPYQFIPLFEGNGMVKDLDEYMFRTVCADLVSWRTQGKRIVPVSINLSRASMMFGDVAERYSTIVDELGVSRELVPIEVTESAADGSEMLKDAANELLEHDFLICMDDFGAGYSSLASLGSLGFCGVKLDKSLIDTIGDAEGEKLIKHSMALAKDLGMHVTAEGVEEQRQMEFLRDLGCDSIQGYYYSRPLPRGDFEVLL